VITTSYTEDGGYQGALEALRLKAPPTAIFAGADIAAMGVLRAAHELGLRVPEDLTVTGYDNTDAAAWPMVSLTTVDQSGRLTGAVSARMLLERIDGRTSPVTFSVSPSLIVRSTSAAPRPVKLPAKRPRPHAVASST
jgi:LacI family transcriptional regulator